MLRLRLRERSREGLLQTLQQYTQTTVCTHTCRAKLSPLVTKSLTVDFPGANRQNFLSVSSDTLSPS